MNRLNVLVFTLLARGHVYPVLPICSELAKRGHAVTFATSDYFASHVVDAGSEALIFESARPGLEYEKWWNSLAELPFDHASWWSPPDEWIQNLHSDTADLYARVCERFEAPPDLVLYDQYYYPGYVVSRRLSSIRVRISAHFANYKDLLIRQDGVCINTPSMLGFATRVKSFLQDEGADERGFWRPEDFNIQLVPGAFQYHRQFFDERFCFCGQSRNRQLVRQWDSDTAQQPLVLISGFSGILGVRYESRAFFQLLIEALGDSEFHCVLLDENAGLSQENLPQNFDALQAVSPLEVLPHASLLVCPGGMGSTVESIYHGVRVLAIPAHPHADEVAFRAAELGVARRIRRGEVSPSKIRESVAELLGDTRVSTKIASMQAAFKRSTQVRDAVDQLEQFVSASRK